MQHKCFLPQEFQAYKKQGSGFFTRVSDSLHNMSASYMMKNRPLEFATMHDYMTLLQDKLGVMDRIAQRVCKEQNGKVYVCWGVGAGRRGGRPITRCMFMCAYWSS